MTKFIVILLTLVSGLNAQDTMRTTNLKIDHLLIAVDNLDSAKRQYESYGFNVVYGGEEETSLNALIFLKDGTAIELVGKDRFPKLWKIFNSLRFTAIFGIMKDRITTFPKIREGFFNYSLYSDNLENTYKHLNKNKFIVDKPVRFSRHRNDSVKIQWELIGTKPYDLPFIIGDYTPSRLSDSIFVEHKNKAVAIDSIVVETIAVDEYIEIYTLLYQISPDIESKNGQKTAYFKIGNITLKLQEVARINSYFKRSLSNTKSFTIKCEHTGKHGVTNLNPYIQLVQ